MMQETRHIVADVRTATHLLCLWLIAEWTDLSNGVDKYYIYVSNWILSCVVDAIKMILSWLMIYVKKPWLQVLLFSKKGLISLINKVFIVNPQFANNLTLLSFNMKKLIMLQPQLKLIGPPISREVGNDAIN